MAKCFFPILFKLRLNISSLKRYSTKENVVKTTTSATEFDTVFSFPYVKYIALLNRLKVYHFIGSSIAIPTSALLETLNIVSEYSFPVTAYVGLTGVAVLSLATLPFNNSIGFLYISKDKQKIKISSINFWGKRVDRTVSVDEWIPIFDITPKITDAVYLRPQLNDGTKYKFFVKFGNVINAKKMSEVLE